MGRPQSVGKVKKKCRLCKQPFESYASQSRAYCSRSCSDQHVAALNTARMQAKSLASAPMKRAVAILIDAGLPAAMVARIFGVSRQRVYQIISEGK